MWLYLKGILPTSTIGGTVPIFHWTMMIGGRLPHSGEMAKVQNENSHVNKTNWRSSFLSIYIEPGSRRLLGYHMDSDPLNLATLNLSATETIHWQHLKARYQKTNCSTYSRQKPKVSMNIVDVKLRTRFFQHFRTQKWIIILSFGLKPPIFLVS